ncbi:hypothetical protein PVL29_002758 [Vitis rotundifolia]|uniref:Uncharacterized protein n=1 Tax=Vitis rotundifolia TaxID=103349 RepID=A0AA39E165_VITRO|nr:hypothetical protein PVL29_002758 [Vitis rotundifolia]
MAESAVSFAVERIGDALLQKAIFLKGVHEQVDRMQRELKRMQCFLKDADAKQQEDESVRNWVSEIRDVAYDAEDAIDAFIFNVESGRTKFFPWRMFKRLVSSYEVGKEIEAIQIKIQDISKSRETYGINSIGEATSQAGQRLQKLRYISPLVKEEIIVGLEEDTDKLVKQLVKGDERRRAVSIVGMGGIGKTTLAKKVYNDRRVMDHFGFCRAWAYVSQDCRPRDVFQNILNQIPYNPTGDEARKIEKMQEYEFGDFLHERLKEQRFLVVLDDVWESDDWERLAKAFPKESKGSRLLLTTRKKDVAFQADARSVPHDMQLLSEKEGWKLFCRSAIPDNVTDGCPPELKEFGEKMVKKCAGLPLAIVVLGGLLSSKKQLPTVWEDVLNKLPAHFSESNGVDAILSLSYIDLPHNLKSCFLYLGLFPEDKVISKRRLLLLWIAEGFIPQQDEQRMEDTAEDYLNELINRNLVQAVSVSVNERVTRCRIHDLVRDLCIKKAKEQNFFEIKNDKVSPSSTSSSLSSTKSQVCFQTTFNFIRSFSPFFESQYHSINFIYKYFKLLRVLDLEAEGVISPPHSLGKLIHLRYLTLEMVVTFYDPLLLGTCFDGLKICPYLLSFLGKLKGLQTLSVRFFTDGPVLIQKMENLQHLSLLSYKTDSKSLLRIETLRNLQTLSGIYFSDWQQNDTSDFTSLRKLKIKVDDATVAEFSNSIAKLANLRSLYLEAVGLDFIIPCFVMNSWLHLSKLQMKGYIPMLPKAHEFPPSLTQLTLERAKLGHDHMEILEKLPKLLIFRLRCEAKYLEEEMQVSADGFPQLKILQLSGLRTWLRTWPRLLIINKGGMPKLTHLQIFECCFNIDGLGELLHLRKVDVNVEYPRWISSLPYASEWHKIRSKIEDATERRDIWHFYR